MRLFRLAVLVCFLWASTHEAVAHAGPCASAGTHHDDTSQATDSPAKDSDRHACDSHGHFRGAVGMPAQSINEDLATPVTPVVFDSVGVYPQEHLLRPLTRVLC